ncbi:oligosaccharide flippase family protein [Algoriphagus chordae]|uniref:Na+-driven multidrug efflux pump n=1 Tax=Algoriphagus chordae TaxID=237019 RepID=A0A2W7QK66_9BACT|nr:oligosaccharide flippase family protein [Algoriphagus chordae]PZX47696.1 Na+-driven multidrug efflux pump [Algoriphagus chordae]
MFSKLKALLGESAIYGIANILTRFITIFLVPIYTKIFSPSDYGDMSLINMSFSLISLMVILGLDSASAFYFYENKGEERKIPIANWFWIQIIFSLLVGIVLCLLAPQFSTLLLGNASYSYAIIIAFSNLFFFSFRVILIKWFRYQRKPIPTVIVTLTASLLTIFLNYYFVVVLRAGINGVFYANLIVSIIFSFVAVWFMWKWISPKLLDLSVMKKMLVFGLPLLPASFSSWINNSSASFFINYLTGSKDEVGLFQIGYNLAGGMLLFTGAFQMAYLPFAYSIKNEKDASETYNLVFLAYTFIGCFCALFIALFSHEILVVLTNEKFYQASFVASVLAFSFFFLGYNSFGLMGLSLAKKTKLFSLSMMIASGINVVFLLISIPLFSKEGAAVALVFSNLLAAIILFYFSQKKHYIRYDFGNALIIIITGISLFSIYLSGVIEGNVGIRLLLLLAFILISLKVLYPYYKFRKTSHD